MEFGIKNALAQLPFHKNVLAVFDRRKALRVAHVHAHLLKIGRPLSDQTVRKALYDLAADGALTRIQRGLYCLPGYRDPALSLGSWVLNLMREAPHQLFDANLLRKRYRIAEGRTLPTELFDVELRSLERCGRIVERGADRFQLSPEDVFA